MKLLLKYICIGGLLCTLSCDKEIENINENSENTLQDNQKTIIVNGQAIYAGYGYDPIEDRAYRSAVLSNEIYESTNIKPALSVEVKRIHNLKNLEDYAKNTYSITSKKSGGFLGLVKKTHTTIREIESRIKVNQEQISFIARIKVKHQRFLVNEEAALIPPAKRLLETRKYDRFLDNYGLLYVSDRTTGGEVQFIYTYNYCNIDRWSRDVFIKKAESNILGIFKKKGSTTVTNEEKQYLEQRQEQVNIISNIPGYAPQIIKSVSDTNREISRIQNYLRSNPHKATTIDMKLKPYSDLFESNTLLQRYQAKKTCLQAAQELNRYYDKVNFVYNNARNHSDIVKAREELNIIRNQINNGQCLAVQNADQKFNSKFANTAIATPCDNYVNTIGIGLQLGDRGKCNNPGGRYNTSITNRWTSWAGDGNFYDPDWIRIWINKRSGLNYKLVDLDFRIAIQLADDRATGGWGHVRYTPWASQGGGWSSWATDSNAYDFDAVRMRIETRYKPNFFIKDFRLGIQLTDHGTHSGHRGSVKFTSWFSQGGGQSDCAGDSNYYDPDAVKIKLEVRR
ncbi:MAC/perforin domain-containing protein [Tenacibaculum amylolyticum]|uniref:MAC/perforin domain-containing protein n=1 Tax=Tenacibaculum amylolyticum TaxID=104269 RepID=UPI003895240E